MRPNPEGAPRAFPEPSLLQRIIDAIPAPVFFKDTAYRYLGCNEAFARDILGREPADVAGKTVHDLASPELARIYEEADRELMRTGGAQQYETRVRFADGRMRDIAFHKAVFRDTDGTPAGIVGVMLDITERKLAEDAQRESERHFRRFVDHAVDAFILHDADGNIRDVNESACRRLGYDREAFIALNVADVDADHSPLQLRNIWEKLLAGDEDETLTLESRHRTRAGEVFPVELRIAAFREEDEPRFLVLASDISERKRNEVLLRERERMFQSVFHASEDAILILDGDTFIDCNEATVRMLRCRSKDEVLPSPPWALSPERQPDGRLSTEKAEEMIQTAFRRHFHRFEWVHRRADGEDFPVEVTLTTVDLEGRRVLYVVWNEITERKQRERRIRELAHFDPLTRLPNRRLLQDHARQALAMAERHKHPVGVMYMDLNRFKDINDTQGHDIGDELLVQVADRLQRCLRDTDTLARLGGDEFAFLLPETDADRMEDIAGRLLGVFDTVFKAGDLSVRLGASIGMVSYPNDGDTLSELLKNADIAMYEAKATSSGYCAFHHQHARRLHARVSLERELRIALDRGELQAHYQPRVEVHDGALHSVEVLARWPDGNGAWIPPAEFIPVAERSGLIHILGQNMLRLACRQCRAWRDEGLDVRVAVNVSALELQREDFVDTTRRTLEECGLPGEFLEIEITETAVMADAEGNIATLSALKSQGVHIAIDDFGTGYSSLSYLKRLPVDCLKVDHSFIRDMIEDPMDSGIVETIVALARSMDINTVAEGVETAEQFRAARTLGCDAVQGYLFAAPQSAEPAASLLTAKYLPLPSDRDGS